MLAISFNSYKGGSCRTTTCYNTLPYLAEILNASAHRPLLVFDVDLDSMGLTNLLTKDKFVSQSGYSAGDLFKNSDNFELKNINTNLRTQLMKPADDPDSFFGKTFIKVGNALGLDDDGSVLFCGADVDSPSITDEDYRLYAERYPLNDLMRALNRMPEEDRPVAIVFDCASGNQPSTRIILQTAGVHVMCMRPTVQFRIGTRDYMLKTLPNEFSNASVGIEHRVVLLPTAVANINISSEEPRYEEARDELTRLKSRVVRNIDRFIVNQVVTNEDIGYVLVDTMLKGDDIGIPEVERFKWHECLLYNMDPLTTAEIKVKERYKMLAEVIVREE